MGDQKRERMSNSPMERNWSRDLHDDLIVSVAKWLSSLEDFTCFGAVCKSWRSATTKLVKEKQYRDTTGIVSRFLTQQVPLLMLPLALAGIRLDFSLLDKEVGFYSPGKGENWTLFHPLNLAKIELPDKGIYLRGGIIEKFALSTSPSGTSDYIVMFHTRHALGFCRPGQLGDEDWKTIIVRDETMMDVVYYKGQFYFLYFSGRVSVFDIDKEELRVVAPSLPKEQLLLLLGSNVRIKKRYLVESGGVLLVVLFTAHTYSSEGLAFGCRVFEVPFTDSKSWVDSEVKSLGKRTIFLTPSSSSFSIEASDYSRCKPNCIYFMNDKIIFPEIRKDMGVYNMEDGTITRDFDSFFGFEEERGNHLWIQPSLGLFF
ncbi:PREDICTED: probable F-box protein At1g44080 [Fragaria vesca subsp. vesca]|uniref:probable F-box protein At1g44080 n=1 Tax=Fragaria vesca subsp. vesca TaxID=101020 RepID=UPI0002C35493|nr:PREDICTED: probable F-box protein At1g44080 [Fragaria vesca subsp. vesca]